MNAILIKKRLIPQETEFIAIDAVKKILENTFEVITHQIKTKIFLVGSSKLHNYVQIETIIQVNISSNPYQISPKIGRKE